MSAALALLADLGAAAGVATGAGAPSASSRARLAQLGTSRRVAQSTLARQLVALAASRLLGRRYPADGVAEAADGAGVRLADAPGLAASIAHSRERVAVVVGRGPLGIDIEYCDGGRDVLALARQAFSAAEVAWLEQAPAGGHSERFYLLWTRREAAYKAGLRAAVLGGEPCLGGPAASASCSWDTRRLGDYRVSVATSRPAALEWLGLAGAELAPLGG